MSADCRFLLHATILGAVITFSYDIFRILRRVLPHSSLMVSLEDLIFWIYCTVEVFLLMYYESDGTLRWFAVLGALTGMLVYKKTLSSYFVEYTSRLFGKLLWLVSKIVDFMLKPLRMAAHGLRIQAVRLKKKLTFGSKVLRMKVSKKIRGRRYRREEDRMKRSGRRHGKIKKKSCISQEYPESAQYVSGDTGGADHHGGGHHRWFSGKGED